MNDKEIRQGLKDYLQSLYDEGKYDKSQLEFNMQFVSEMPIDEVKYIYNRVMGIENVAEEIDQTHETPWVKALLIRVGEEPEQIEVENHFRALQKIVGGNIEFYSVDHQVNIICNEEGKLIGLEGNRQVGDEIICGDFLIVGNDGMGETISLSDEQVEQYTEKFKIPQELTREQVDESRYFKCFTVKDNADIDKALELILNQSNSSEKGVKDHER